MARIRTTIVSVSAAALLTLAAGCSSGDDAGAAGTRSSSPTSSPSAASSTQTEQAVDAVIAAGVQQVQDQQYDQATATFRSALDLDADNSYALYNLGLIAQTRGDDATAIRNYTDVLARDKDFSQALHNLAILTERSSLPGAVALYRREVAIRPDDAAAYTRLGYALRHLGRTAQADRMLARGIDLDPTMADVTPPTYD